MPVANVFTLWQHMARERKHLEKTTGGRSSEKRSEALNATLKERVRALETS